MRTGDFDYDLPAGLIAQTPVEPRDSSRLMVLHRKGLSVEHRHFFDLPAFLSPGDVLVFNDTRVIPARLFARKDTGARLEILLLQRLERNIWKGLVRPGNRVHIGTGFTVFQANGQSALTAAGEIVQVGKGGVRTIRFDDDSLLAALGNVPLPPYIHAPLQDAERYQTVYSRVEGSAAAPTAGLHFTPRLIQQIADKGVRCVYVTLHVGLDTFQPVREQDPEEHQIHTEFGVITPGTLAELRAARADHRRVVCVGTTSMRLVEAAASAGALEHTGGFSDWVDLFILPGYRFQVADAMITNFHLPRTTLIMLVSAFAGREFILDSYLTAIQQQYRFYSFGDAMLIL
jgi:S-adenosylmethionine:tRNA ribosyltransferase-isomerase